MVIFLASTRFPVVGCCLVIRVVHFHSGRAHGNGRVCTLSDIADKPEVVLSVFVRGEQNIFVSCD